ncbi:MAG: DUF3530 family protein, partial [Gammaproteobacteria bacterium]|nr:DUF3530 family protein [Gammaproteobacteria bacterium]
MFAAAPAAEDADEQTPEQALPAGVIANQYAQDEEVARVAVDDEAFWLEEPGGRVLILHRAVRRGAPRGSMILVSGPGLGYSGLSHSANLRTSLALYGWNTYFVRLPEFVAPVKFSPDGGGVDEQEFSAGENRVRAAVELVRGRTNQGLVILIAEASGSRGLGIAASDLGVDGLILLNLNVTRATTTLLKDMTTPTFVLQEQPARWQKKYPLA